ncbi:MAG: ribose-phosphate diphosphokinase [Planctomycetota bacterium]|jgi:ribose-phosphate pyrophosphokinase
MDNLALFAGTANLPLAEAITEYLGTGLGHANVATFPDGEILVKLEEDVRGRDVFIIQSTCAPTNEALMELLIFIDCARRASAERVTAVIPYYGYARQDRKDEGRTPITAKLVANLIVTAGADRVLTVDLHAGQIQGFFDIPVDNLYAEPVLSREFRSRNWDDLVVVSPDPGSTRRAGMYAARLGADLAIVDKRRISGDSVKHGYLIGDVKDKTVLMMDDMITTGGTICGSAQVCKDAGAKAIYVGASHGVLVGDSATRLREAPIDEVVVTDTVPIPPETIDAIGKLKVLSVAMLMGEAIHRIHNDESVSSLFQMNNGG